MADAAGSVVKSRPASSTPAFVAAQITKTYPAVSALRDVSIAGYPGEVVAICGANGAGKSTFARLLSGHESPTHGTLRVGNRTGGFRGPTEAEAAGVLLMHQEPLIIEDLTVGENVWLRSLRRLPWDRPQRGNDPQTRAALRAVGLGDIDIDTPAAQLSPGQRQMLALSRAHMIDHDILILDETTASTTVSYFEKIVEFVDVERAAGKNVIIVSHKLGEIFRVADRIVVLRDGRLVGELKAAETNPQQVAELMAGGAVEVVTAQRDQISATPDGPVALETRKLRAGGARDVSLAVHEGEVLGVYGLVGSGRSSWARAITGQIPVDGGTILLRGKQVKLGSPVRALRHGVAYISEDRRREGFIPDFSNQENLLLSNLRGVSTFSVISRRRQRARAQSHMARFAITGALDTPTITLSGGNQQKVCVASKVESQAAVLVFDEPTKGVDIAAKQSIYKYILELAAEGRAVVVVSSEEDELLAVSERIVVMRAGRVVDRFDHVADLNAAQLVRSAIGGDQT